MASALPSQTTVLIIEDDNFISIYLEDKLKQQFRTITAATAQAAREILTRETVSLIVLDILLPDENGFILLAELKEKSSPYKHIPILVLSNLDQPADIARGKELGAADYLVKANQLPADVAQRIRDILAAPT